MTDDVMTEEELKLWQQELHAHPFVAKVLASEPGTVFVPPTDVLGSTFRPVSRGKAKRGEMD